MSDLRVYFEKQGGDRLCGVHCLNALLQNPVFSQADLNKFASDVEKQEAALLADPSKPKPPRQMTISSLSNQPKSDHKDDTGYFSLPVLEKALGTKYGISVQNAARRDIIQQINREGLERHDGFVIHLHDHWFAARAIPNPQYPGVREWFFLDSLKSGPQPVTENELWGTLQGIIQSGGNVFILTGGRLPACQTSSSKSLTLRSHQFLLTREEIKRRLSGDTSSSEPSKKPKTTDWSSLGQAQTLGSSSGKQQSSSKPSTALPPLKPEPPTTTAASEVVNVLVRLPSGQRVVRRFSLSDSLGDLFVWIDSTADPSEACALVGTMDKRGWKLSRKSRNDKSFSFIPGLGSEEITLSPTAPLTEARIESGQEVFNLS
jgi:ataxin-3